MTGGKKKRRDIQTGVDRAEDFTNRAIAEQQPFQQAGASAIEQLLAIAGLSGDEAQAEAGTAFDNSLFQTAGANAFQNASDRINDSFSSQGLAFSGANLEAKETARQNTFQNAFNSFLNNSTNLAGFGQNATNNVSNLLANQGQTAFSGGLASSGTRQGVLGGINQFGNALTSLFPQRGG